MCALKNGCYLKVHLGQQKPVNLITFFTYLLMYDDLYLLSILSTLRMVQTWLKMTILIQKHQKLINMPTTSVILFFYRFFFYFDCTIFIPPFPPLFLRPGCTRKKNERTNPSSHFVHSQIAAFRHQRPCLYMLELSADKSPFYNSKKGKQKGRRSPWLLSLKKNT